MVFAYAEFGEANVPRPPRNPPQLDDHWCAKMQEALKHYRHATPVLRLNKSFVGSRVHDDLRGEISEPPISGGMVLQYRQRIQAARAEPFCHRLQ
jgi:hypothetical protein